MVDQKNKYTGTQEFRCRFWLMFITQQLEQCNLTLRTIQPKPNV